MICTHRIVLLPFFFTCKTTTQYLKTTTQCQTRVTKPSPQTLLRHQIVVAVIKFMDSFADTRRYSLAAKALETGNTQVAAAALAPDVGRGVGAGLGALGLGNVRKF